MIARRTLMGSLLALASCAKDETSQAQSSITHEQYERERAARKAKLGELAREKAEPIALARADSLLAGFVEEHERQVAGFTFSCRRFGDFLTVYVERNGNPDRPQYVDSGPAHYTSTLPVRKFSTTLNIGRATAIKLVEGNTPDRTGVLTYYGEEVYGEASLHDPDKVYSDDKKLVVMILAPSAPYSREAAQVDEPPRAQTVQYMTTCSNVTGAVTYSTPVILPVLSGTIGGEDRGVYQTQAYPRPAKDDQLKFIGIGATLYAPAGLGKEMERAVQMELANAK